MISPKLSLVPVMVFCEEGTDRYKKIFKDNSATHIFAIIFAIRTIRGITGNDDSN